MDNITAQLLPTGTTNLHNSPGGPLPTRGAFHQAFCQCFSLTNLLSANQDARISVAYKISQWKSLTKPEMPTFKNQKQYSEREKTVFWPQKKYFVKNNEGEGANCIAASLSLKKKVLLSLKKNIWGEKKYFCARSAHHEREARSPFSQGLGPA